MPFRFLHLADTHLETPFGSHREETRERLRESVRKAFQRAVDHVLEHRLHALIVAGDLFDDGLLSLRTERFLTLEIERLTDAGASFLYCCGNHDPGGEGFRGAALRCLGGADSDVEREPWRARVHAFRRPEPSVVVVEDAQGRPVGRVVGAGHPDTACGQNLARLFPRRAELIDASGTDLPTIGLLHTQVDGAAGASAHERYAPCSPDDLRRAGYDYWALGHVHRRGRVADDLPAHYPGNLQGRNPRERGAKGGLIVEARAGAPAEPEFLRLAQVRWERIELPDLARIAQEEELVERIVEAIERERGGGEELLCHVHLEGPSPLFGALRDDERRDELAALIREESAALEVWLETASVVPPVDPAALRATPTILARALNLLDAARDDEALLDELAPEALAGLEDDEDPEARAEYLRGFLDQLEPVLLGRVLDPDRVGQVTVGGSGGVIAPQDIEP